METGVNKSAILQTYGKARAVTHAYGKVSLSPKATVAIHSTYEEWRQNVRRKRRQPTKSSTTKRDGVK